MSDDDAMTMTQQRCNTPGGINRTKQRSIDFFMLMMMNKLFRLVMEALNKVFGTRLSNNKIFCIILDLEHILFYRWSLKMLYSI